MAAQADLARVTKVVIGALVLGVLAAGYIAYTYWEQARLHQSQVSKLGYAGPQGERAETPAYSDVLRRYNERKATEAAGAGSSYLSVPGARKAEVQKVDPAPPAKSSTPTNYYYQPPKQDPEVSKELLEQVKALLSNWSSAPHSAARVAKDGGDYAASMTPVRSDVEEERKEGRGHVAKVVGDFELVPALLMTDIDTDENSMVIANVPAGQYAGAQLFAMGYKRLTNTVDMTFTYMKWRGRSYKVTAKALDQTSMRTALSGDVNNRYFSRIIVPAIASGIGRVGQLYGQAASQTIITPQGGVIQAYPETPSGRAVGGVIAGGTAEHAGRVLSQDAAALPVKQVLIASGTTIGIQFVGPVLESDDVVYEKTGQNERDQSRRQELDALGRPASPPERRTDVWSDRSSYPGALGQNYPRGYPTAPPIYYGSPQGPGYSADGSNGGVIRGKGE